MLADMTSTFSTLELTARTAASVIVIEVVTDSVIESLSPGFAPGSDAERWARHRFFFMCLILPVGFLAAWSFGPVVEGWFFAGDVKAWLDGRIGNGRGTFQESDIRLSTEIGYE